MEHLFFRMAQTCMPAVNLQETCKTEKKVQRALSDDEFKTIIFEVLSH